VHEALERARRAIPPENVAQRRTEAMQLTRDVAILLPDHHCAVEMLNEAFGLDIGESDEEEEDKPDDRLKRRRKADARSAARSADESNADERWASEESDAGGRRPRRAADKGARAADRREGRAADVGKEPHAHAGRTTATRMSDGRRRRATRAGGVTGERMTGMHRRGGHQRKTIGMCAWRTVEKSDTRGRRTSEKSDARARRVRRADDSDSAERRSSEENDADSHQSSDDSESDPRRGRRRRGSDGSDADGHGSRACRPTTATPGSGPRDCAYGCSWASAARRGSSIKRQRRPPTDIHDIAGIPLNGCVFGTNATADQPRSIS
jgi:hypothetical protein